MRRTAVRLFGNYFQWSVLGTGRHQMKIASLALQSNGSVRVGLEDSLWSGPGKMAESNAEQVATAKQLAESFGREIATPAQARAILKLKGLASN
jgi:uncharacterized protein (DUF849 family)